MKANIVCHDWTTELRCAVEKQFISERGSAVFLRGQNIYLSKAQLTNDSVIDVHVEIK